MSKKVLIMGAAGRDFHNFNVYFRDNRDYNVVAFTATQIPNIDDRVYPAELAGSAYPDGIPILPEDDLKDIILKNGVDTVVFSYSDVSHEYVMHKASLVNGAGADFVLLGLNKTSLKSQKPVIAVCAVRTGCGKSQTTRRIGEILRSRGRKVVVIRHPMPYGDLKKQKVQRFEKYEDMTAQNCSIEEMEEYEPHIEKGHIVYAGVDYGAILKQAEKEADVILWDGGNNDTPFYKPDLHITVVDPHRPGHELLYYPGETNFRTAHVIIINKMDTADTEGVRTVRQNISRYNPGARVIEADSPIAVDHPEHIRGKRVLVIEDGPTLTHGGMSYGAGTVAANEYGASEIIDPRAMARGSIADTFKKYPDTGPLLPAMGYGSEQIRELQATIEAVACDTVIIGTPIDLNRLIPIKQQTVRVRYSLKERGKPDLLDVLESF